MSYGDSSPTEPFHMDASKVMLPHCESGVQSLCTKQNPVCKYVSRQREYNEFSIIHNKLIMLYFPITHVYLNLGYWPIIIVQDV